MKSSHKIENNRRFRNALRPFALLALLTLSLLVALFARVEANVSAQSETQVNGNINANLANREPPALSTVRGRILYEDTGQPVRRAGVMLWNLEGGGGSRERGSATNTRGEFALHRVAAGRYVVAVNAPGIITPMAFMNLNEAMGSRSRSLSDMVDMNELRANFEEVSVDGTSDTTVTVHVRRGGAIAGRITYADGNPAINVQIGILRKAQSGQFVPFLSSFTPFSNLRTDDRGMYRAASLPPGEYVVSAAEMNTGGGVGEGREEEAFVQAMFGGISDSLITTFYPNVTSAAAATPIRIGSGSEAAEINITLLEPNTYSVSGTVTVRRGGRPAAGATINIRNRNESGATSLLSMMGGMSGGHRTQTDEQGRWSFPEVPDGTYIVTVEPPPPQTIPANTAVVTNENGANVAVTRRSRPAVAPQRRLTRREQEVRVAGGDVTGLTIDLSEGGRIAGTVTLEGGGTVQQYGAMVMLDRASEERSAERPFEREPSFIDQNGNFVIDGITNGAVYLDVISPVANREESGFYVKSVTAPNGADLLREPINVTSETDITGIRVVLARGMATLTGRVTAEEGGAIVRGASVTLIPADARRWARRSGRAVTFADAEGNFTTTVAPGEYLIFVERQGSAIGFDENRIRAQAGRATRVTLAPNERRNVDVVVATSATSN